MTPKQQELKNRHGTPTDFTKAISKAFEQGFITHKEMTSAGKAYQTEWDQTGNENFPCWIVIDPTTQKPVCIAKEQDELEACLSQRNISKINFKKRRLFITSGTFNIC